MSGSINAEVVALSDLPEKPVDQWILDEYGQPKPAPFLQWAMWMKESHKQRVIARTDTTRNGVYVSTVFLGLDHNCSELGPPLLFETMISCGAEDDAWSKEHNQSIWRCSTRAQAEAQHAATVAMVQSL